MKLTEIVAASLALLMLVGGPGEAQAPQAEGGETVAREALAPRVAEYYLDAVTRDMENLALREKGARITATHERNAVANLLDGDPVTGYDAPFEHEQVSLTLSWPETQTFDCVYWERTRGLGPDARELTDADFLVSDDGQQWRKVAETRGFTGQFDYVRFPEVSARFLRLDVLKTSGGHGVVIWDLRVHRVGDREAPDWWDARWTWRARLSPVEVGGPAAVSARLDFSRSAIRWGRHVVLDSLRVVERDDADRILSAGASEVLPSLFVIGEGFVRPSNQNGTLLWVAPPGATDPRHFDVYFAFNDDPPVPSAGEPVPGLTLSPTAAGGATYEATDPALRELLLRDEFNQPRGRLDLAAAAQGPLPEMQLGCRYWVEARGPTGTRGYAWVPQRLAAPGSLGLSLPRFAWLRGEELPVSVSLPADSAGERVTASLLWQGTSYTPAAEAPLEAVGGGKSAQLHLPSEALAHGVYRLVLVAEGPQGPVDVRTATVNLAQPREAPFPYGYYGLPRLQDPQAEDDWRMLADLGARLVLERDADTALRYRMQIVGKLMNYEHSLQPQPDAPWVAYAANGHPMPKQLSYNSEEVRRRYWADLSGWLGNYASHPGFSDVIFWHDDGQLHSVWEFEQGEDGRRRRWYPQDYSPMTAADFQAKTGHRPPTPQETPRRTGVVPEDDPWLLWLTYRCDDYYAGLTRYLMQRKSEVNPEVALVQVHGGGGPNTYVALSDGLYPPYDQAANDWVGSYFYPGSFWPTLDYLWQIQVGWMGNRGRPTWMTTGLHTAWAPLAILNKFHMVLAAGYDSLVHFIYDYDLYKPETEGYQILRQLGEMMDDYEALYRALETGEPRIAVLYPFTSVAFGMAGEFFEYVNHRHFETTARTLVRHHVPIAVLAEEEVRAGLLTQYDMLIIPPIQALRQSVHERVVAWAATGKPVLLLEGSQVDIPGARTVNWQSMVEQAQTLPAGRPLLKPDSSDAVVGNLHVGETPFVYVVNAYADRWVVRREDRAYGVFAPLNPDPHLEEWPDLEEVRGTAPRPMREVEVRLSGERGGRYLYDLYAHQEVPWPAEGLRLTLPPAEGRLLAVYQARLGETQLALPEQATTGETVRVTVTLLQEGGGPFEEPVPLKLLVESPGGEPSVYSRSLLAQGGRAEVDLPLAVNDPAGMWRVVIRNLATGEQVSRSLRVESR